MSDSAASIMHGWMQSAVAALLIINACGVTIGEEMRRNVTVYFESFAGYDLPLRPVGEIPKEQAKAASNYYVAEYDAVGRLKSFASTFDGGKVFFKHEYTYHDNGKLKTARVTSEEGRVRVHQFAIDGRLLSRTEVDPK
jgi:hypothetical protein